jgi:hypothetical protein
MVEAAVCEGAGWANAAVAGCWLRPLARDATQSLGVERIHGFRASESRLIADPESAVLLPREVRDEVVFWVDIVAERA